MADVSAVTTPTKLNELEETTNLETSQIFFETQTEIFLAPAVRLMTAMHMHCNKNK